MAATVTSVGDGSFTDKEGNVVIGGTGFGATQGAGVVVISPSDNVNDAGRVLQTVTGWGATSITITTVRAGLSVLTPLYLFVDPDADTPNASGFPVEFFPFYKPSEIAGVVNSTTGLGLTVDLVPDE